MAVRVLALATVTLLVFSGPAPVGSASIGSASIGSASIGSASIARAPLTPAVAVDYQPPLPAPLVVLHPFDAPASPYAAGERGVDLVTSAGTAVVSAGPGVVRFAGMVAGRGLVVVTHPDGISTEYEPVAAAVTAGQSVAAGELIGTVAGLHPGCETQPCLHWGARRGDLYLDPFSLLERLGVVRLLPWS